MPSLLRKKWQSSRRRIPCLPRKDNETMPPLMASGGIGLSEKPGADLTEIFHKLSQARGSSSGLAVPFLSPRRWTAGATGRRHSRATGRRTARGHGRSLYRARRCGKFHHNAFHAALEHHLSLHIARRVNCTLIAADQAALLNAEGERPIPDLGRLQKRHCGPLPWGNVHAGGLGVKVNGGFPLGARGVFVDHICHKNPFLLKNIGGDKRLRPSQSYYSTFSKYPQEKLSAGT